MAALIYLAPSWLKPIIAFGAPFQLKSGRASTPRLPQTEQAKRGSRLVRARPRTCCLPKRSPLLRVERTCGCYRAASDSAPKAGVVAEQRRAAQTRRLLSAASYDTI